MRKAMVLLAATAAALGIAGQAAMGFVGIKPDPVELVGSIEHSGEARVGVSYVKRNGHLYRRYRYEFSGIAVRCDGETREAKDPLNGSELIWAKYADRNPFGATEISGPFGDPVYKGTVFGKLVNPGTARGWVRVSGRRVPLQGGGHEECDSGRLHWVARG